MMVLEKISNLETDQINLIQLNLCGGRKIWNLMRGK